MTMERKMTEKKWTFADTAVIAALTALTAAATLFIRVPIPATNGYFNIGDVFIILAGLWLGPTAGFIAGAVGSSIADAIGFPVYIPATFVIKGFEGFITGLIARNSTSASLFRPSVAAFLGGSSVIWGYFIFEAFIYPELGKTFPVFAITDRAAAIVSLFPNAIQGVTGAVGGLALWKALAGSSRQDDSVAGSSDNFSG
ncbi:MAG: ECF transporter S component [Erysipelotrichia bacterium]|nr:ECF transporter S component [Erysipelotrichia bacterium]